MACIGKSWGSAKINSILEGCQHYEAVLSLSPSSYLQAEEKSLNRILISLQAPWGDDCVSRVFADVDLWQGNKLITVSVSAFLRSPDVWSFIMCTLTANRICPDVSLHSVDSSCSSSTGSRFPACRPPGTAACPCCLWVVLPGRDCCCCCCSSSLLPSSSWEPTRGSCGVHRDGPGPGSTCE